MMTRPSLGTSGRSSRFATPHAALLCRSIARSLVRLIPCLSPDNQLPSHRPTVASAPAGASMGLEAAAHRSHPASFDPSRLPDAKRDFRLPCIGMGRS